MTLTGQRFEITAGGWRAEVSTNGAALAGLWRDGVAITVAQPADQLPFKGNGQVLVPWPNRIRDGRYTFDGVDYQLALTEPANHNAAHGLARWSRFKVTAHSADSITLAVDLVPLPGYPFELAFSVHYRLEPERGLVVAAHATNRGVRALPFGAGFHPYVDLGDHDLDHTVLEVPAQSVIVVDDRKVPVSADKVEGTPYDLTHQRPLGTLRLDHCFTDLTANRASVSVGGRTTSVWWDEAFGYLQVFTPEELAPGRRAIAMEPMTCAANAFNTGAGVVRLEPGRTWQGTWGITCS